MRVGESGEAGAFASAAMAAGVVLASVAP